MLNNELYIDAALLGVRADGSDQSAALVAADAIAVASGLKLLIPLGDVNVGADIDLDADLVFRGTLDIDNGFTVTVNGFVDRTLKQLFKGDGSVEFSDKVFRAYPEWFGAQGDDATDDYAAITKCLDACLTNTVEVGFTQTYQIGTQLLIPCDVPVYSNSKARIKPNGVNTEGVMITGTSSNVYQNLPIISGFDGVSLTVEGANLDNIKVPTIVGSGAVGSIALQLKTIAENTNLLDTNINVNSISACETAISIFPHDDAATIQGNKIYGNFLTDCNNFIVWDATNLTTSCNWDSNHFEFEAIDQNGNDGNIFYCTDDTISVIRQTVKVNSWTGGWGATYTLIDGKFIDSQFHINLAEALDDGAIEIEGRRNIVNFFNRSASNDAAVPLVAASGKGAFNGGVSLYKNENNVSWQLAADFLDGTNLTLYAYHQITDGVTHCHRVFPNEIGLMRCMVNQVVDNSGAVDDEIQIVLRNTTGATITSGTNINFTLVSGL